jgi:hypothetical protein
MTSNYKLKFALDAQSSNELVVGLLTLYKDGSAINSYRATSSRAGHQNIGSWNYTGGLLPPTIEIVEHTGKGLSVATTPLILDIKGVNGEFYPIYPYNTNTDGDNRGDWGIHIDLDPRPGTMGCIGLKTRVGMKALIRDMGKIASLGIKVIELEVVYY